MKIFKLKQIAFRVPELNDLYINKNKKIQRNKAFNCSRRAEKRIIVKEVWRTK